MIFLKIEFPSFRYLFLLVENIYVTYPLNLHPTEIYHQTLTFADFMGGFLSHDKTYQEDESLNVRNGLPISELLYKNLM